MVDEIKSFFRLSKPEHIEVNPKDISSLKIHLTSMTFMYNMIQNDSDKVIIIDTRSTMDILRSHINFNFSHDTMIPVPSDLILTKNLEAIKNETDLLKVGEF
jgi:secreted protein with Ig-like and vWFA domain